MDGLTFILQAIQIIPRLLPQKKPPVIDYSSLIQAIPRAEIVQLPPAPAPTLVAIPSVPVAPATPTGETEDAERQQTGCIPCSRSHLSTVSGALGESLRFAREEGNIGHPEVQRRLMLAEDEINIMERIDLAPDALAASPPDQQQLAQEYLPKIRALRQDIGTVTSLEKLEKVAANASVLGQEFRLRHLQLQGVDLNPVMELAKKVQAGEIDMEEAKAQLRELLPDEEE